MKLSVKSKFAAGLFVAASTLIIASNANAEQKESVCIASCSAYKSQDVCANKAVGPTVTVKTPNSSATPCYWAPAQPAKGGNPAVAAACMEMTGSGEPETLTCLPVPADQQ